MKKDNNKNGFLITWVSCIVFLLMLCFFGINSAVKDTYAASYTCDSGYTLVASKYCCPSTRTYVSGRCVNSTDASNGYCTKTVTANSSAEISSACGSGFTNTSATSLLGGTFTVNCKSTSLSVCGSAPKNATASGSTTYACYKTSAGHVWVSTDSVVASANPKVSGVNSEASCKALDSSSSDSQGGSTTYACYKTSAGHVWVSTDSAVASSGTKVSSATTKSACEALNNSSSGSTPSGGNNTSSSCSYDIWSGSYKDANGKPCSITTSSCPAGYYDSRPSNATSCDVKVLEDGNACFNCTVNTNVEDFCGEGTHVGYDEAGNKVCLPDCECDGEGDCTEDEIKDESFCWNCDGKYYWGFETQYPNCSLTYKSKNNCTGSGTKPVSPSSKPSSSVPSSSKPSSSVPSSSVPSSSKPSSSNGNVTENPQTGQIAIFIIWIVGLATIGYSVWYFRNTRKEN